MSIKKKLLMGSLSGLLAISNLCIVHAEDAASGRNLKQRSLEVVENMPNIPSNYKLLNWA